MLSPPIEGSHVASRRIIDAVTRKGIITRVLTAEPHLESSPSTHGWSKVKCKYLNREAEFSPSIFSYMRGFTRTSINDFATSTRLSACIKSIACDAVHALNINKEIFLFVHKLLHVKKPLLLHFYHSPEVLKDDVFQLRNIAMKAGLFGRLFDNYILTTSLSLAKLFIQQGVDRKKVYYAPYPIDIEIFKPITDTRNLRKRYGLRQAHPILVYVGSLNPARGIFGLIKSFRFVLNRFPNALLYVSHPQRMGEDVYAEKLIKMTRSLKIQENTLVQGAVSSVAEVFNFADVVALPFVRPYWMDPPIVLLEAMSTGASVVTTSVGSIGEVIDNHRNAVLAEPANPVDLANQIIELFEDPERCRKIGQQARETVVQKFSYAKVGERLLKIYDRVINN